MRKTYYWYLFHTVSYYIAWFATIFSARNENPWGGPIVVVFITILQWFFLRKKVYFKHLVYFTLTLSGLGFIIDSIAIQQKLLTLAANPLSPFSSPWMIGIWVNFAVIFYDCARTYFKHYIIIGLLALLGFPVAYFAGAKLQAASLPHHSVFLIYLGVIWGILLPIICYSFYILERNNDFHTQ